MSHDLLSAAAHRLLGPDAAVTALRGEHDLNARVDDAGRRFTLKVHAGHTSREELDVQDQALAALEAAGVPAPRLVRREDVDGRVVRLLSWVDGVPYADHHGPDLGAVGHLAGRVDRALAAVAETRPVAIDRWRMLQAGDVLRSRVVLEDDVRAYVDSVADEFESTLLPGLLALPRHLVHNDGNEHNLLVDGAGRAAGVIDMGDLDVAPPVCSAATVATYALLNTAAPQRSLVEMLLGYHRAHPLTREEIDLLPGLVRTRIAMSIVNAAEQSRENPDNAALVSSQAAIREVLPVLHHVLGPFCAARLRTSCGYAPVDHAREVVRWLESADCDPAGVVDGIPPGAVADEIPQELLLAGSQIGDDGTHVRAGGYGQNRHVYTAAEFRATESGDEPRTVHLAIDVMASAGTTLRAPFDGVVEAVGYRDALLDYGGVLMLRHETPGGVPFWFLLGHLERGVADRWQPGDRVARGEGLAALGAPGENGQWAPHLHAQLFTDLLGTGGSRDCLDLPGVAKASERDVWMGVCPDPNLVLRYQVRRTDAAGPGAPTLARRRAHLSATLSLSYAAPLELVEGRGAELISADGDAYLDLVNNVAHVGHGHPHVVEALHEQSARLNTNTRYLHPAVTEYARRLAATLPDPLTTVFLTNSGSEANDLALRLARAATGRTTTVALEHGYHGNLTSLIDISHYKACGPGGLGPGRGVRFVPLPGAYRGPDAETALAAFEAGCAELDEPVGCFIHESISGVGGQVELAEGYLAGAYQRVRAAGGVCVADEVQTGAGRVGDAMWAFETHGVVPDIVTMGKPIGNGHPLGAVVCTPQVARAFETGMEYFNTFGGNPVSARVGLAVLDVLTDERLRARAATVGGRFKRRLAELAGRHESMGDVRGRGLFLGVELVSSPETRDPAPALASAVIEHAVGQGVLLSVDGPDHNVLKIKPPMVISDAQVDRAVRAIGEALDLYA